jgi:hypothetical protein
MEQIEGLDPATDQYINDIEKNSFSPEDFGHPGMKDMTSNAKDVARQVMRGYNSGDDDVRAVVRNYELEVLRQGRTKNYRGSAMEREEMDKYTSKDKLLASTAWNIFYQAHQRYIGDVLTQEKSGKSLPPGHLEALNDRYGFDMEGRPVINLRSLVDAGKLKPKGINGGPR